MKRVAAAVLCVLYAAPLVAQNGANAPVDDKIDTPLEYYFGALALIAIVMTWIWLILKIKNRKPVTPEDLKPPPPVTENNE
jgi:hypothetical protein